EKYRQAELTLRALDPKERERKKELKQLVKAIESWFKQKRLRIVDSALWTLPGASHTTLWKPDLLHTIHLGMTDHLMGWFIAFLKDHKLLETFENVWVDIPKHPSIRISKRSYSSVKQWSGKEMRNLGRVILAMAEATLSSPKNSSSATIFRQALDCISGYVDFHLMCQYRAHSHDRIFDRTNKYGKPSVKEVDSSDTLSYMHMYLCQFFENLD